MTRQKKTRKTGQIGARKDDAPRAPRAPSPMTGKKRKGNKPGSRHNHEQQTNSPAHSNSSNQDLDKRIGSKKPVALDTSTVETPVMRNLKPSAKVIKATHDKPLDTQPIDEAALMKELDALEHNDRFLGLFEQVDSGGELPESDRAFFKQCMDRHDELLNLLGIDDDDETSDIDSQKPQRTDEELLNDFENAQWDPTHENFVKNNETE